MQAYFIAQDTWVENKVATPLAVITPTAEIAALFLAVILLHVFRLLVLIALSLLLCRLNKGAFVPRRKIQWIVQEVREVHGRRVHDSVFGSKQSQLREHVRESVFGMFKTGVNVHTGMTPPSTSGDEKLEPELLSTCPSLSTSLNRTHAMPYYPLKICSIMSREVLLSLNKIAWHYRLA